MHLTVRDYWGPIQASLSSSFCFCLPTACTPTAPTMEASKKVDSTSPLQTNPPLKLPPSAGVAVLVPELGGYKERFVKAVEDKYKCEKCRLVLCDPKQTECGHRFCDSCMAALLR